MDSKEQKSISSWEELTAIAALIAEGDRLRAELAQRDDLIAAFEGILSDVGDGQYIHTEWNELKAQHLGNQAAHVLTTEQAQVLELLSISDMSDEIASALPVYAEFPILLSFGYVYVMDDSIDTDFEITPTGRAALRAYQEANND